MSTSIPGKHQTKFRFRASEANERQSAWWGESFVSELTRISEQAESKLQVRREPTLVEDSKDTPADEATSNSDIAHRPTGSRSQTTA